jgi:hypothetical protein
VLENQPLFGQALDIWRRGTVLVEQLQIMLRVVLGNDPNEVGLIRRRTDCGEAKYRKA